MAGRLQDYMYRGGSSDTIKKAVMPSDNEAYKIKEPHPAHDHSSYDVTNVTFNKTVISQPDAPKPVFTSGNNGSTKIADPDIIQFDDEAVPVELITDLTFEQIGGQEIINVARNDLINGQNVIYKPIKNLQDIYLRYNSKNIVGLQQTSEETFRNFPIKLVNYIPEEGNGPGGSYVYLDSQTGDIVVDLVGVRSGDQVDIDVVNQASTFDDTIYIEGNS